MFRKVVFCFSVVVLCCSVDFSAGCTTESLMNDQDFLNCAQVNMFSAHEKDYEVAEISGTVGQDLGCELLGDLVGCMLSTGDATCDVAFVRDFLAGSEEEGVPSWVEVAADEGYDATQCQIYQVVMATA